MTRLSQGPTSPPLVLSGETTFNSYCDKPESPNILTGRPNNGLEIGSPISFLSSEGLNNNENSKDRALKSYQAYSFNIAEENYLPSALLTPSAFIGGLTPNHEHY